MRKDPTEFRKRFQRWKQGDTVYEAGLPKFVDGTEGGSYGYQTEDNHPIKFDEQGNLVDQITGDVGTMRLPEVQVSIANPTNYRSSYNPNAIRNFTDWLPLAGEAGIGVDITDAIKNKDYVQAAMLSGMTLLPPAIGRAMKRPFASAYKYLNNAYRKYKRGNTPATEFSPTFLAPTIADKQTPLISVLPTNAEKAAFIARYNKFSVDPLFSMSDIYNITGKSFQEMGINTANRLQKLFRDNPEYYKFVKQLYDSSGKQIDPLDQNILNDFFTRQGISLRGVHSPTDDDAIRFLTTTEKGRRMPGGDRLRSNGGLYTSNSTNVGDTFKNSEDALENGYVGKLFYDLKIDKSLTPEQQLLQYRKKIFPAANSNPLGGSLYYGTAVDDAIKNGAVAFEADYVGRANKGKPGYERVYLPKESGVDTPVTILQLENYGKQKNRHGRWMLNGDAGSGDGLFISRQLNNTTDFINTAKSFLSGYKIKDYAGIRKKEDELYELFNNQLDKRNRLLNKQRIVTNKIVGRALSFGSGAAGGVAGVGGISYLLNNVAFDQHFMQSPEFKEFTKRTDITEENVDSIQKFYKDKYRARLRNERNLRKKNK